MPTFIFDFVSFGPPYLEVHMDQPRLSFCPVGSSAPLVLMFVSTCVKNLLFFVVLQREEAENSPTQSTDN